MVCYKKKRAEYQMKEGKQIPPEEYTKKIESILLRKEDTAAFE